MRSAANAAPMQLSIELSVTDAPSEIVALASEWTALLAQAENPNIFLTPQWIASWWRHFGSGELRIIVARSNGQLVGLAPLQVCTVGPARRRELRFLGGGEAAAEHLEFVLLSGLARDVAAEMATLIASCDDIDVLRFEDLRADSVTVTAIDCAFAARGLTVERAVGPVCLHLTIDRSWDERLAMMSSNARQQVRRLPRRLESRTGATVSACATPAEVAEAFDHIEQWNPRRWEERGQASAFADAPFAAFHRDFALQALSEGWLRLFVARTSDEVLAVFYALHHGDVASFYNSAFDPQYERLGVGRIVFDHAIEQAHVEGLGEYDFLRGDYDYKRRWTNRERTTVSLVARFETPRARLDAVGAGATRLARRGRDLVRAKVRPRVMLDRWHLAITSAAPGAVIDQRAASTATWIAPRDPNVYWADPFFASEDDHRHILCEQYDYRNPEGRIVALTIGDDGEVEEHGEVLEVDGHASFPFVFHHDDQTWCIPETQAMGEISLHRAVELPHRWERVATLVEFAGIDSTVVRYDGRWWLFSCSAADRGTSELYLWSADDLTGPWTAHTQNPVKVDHGCARSAGAPFADEKGRLVRPVQDCSERYGGRIVLCEIDEMTMDVFTERVIATLEPPAGYEGMHTINYGPGGRAVFDAAKTMPMWRSPVLLRHVMRTELRRYLRRS